MNKIIVDILMKVNCLIKNTKLHQFFQKVIQLIAKLNIKIT